MPLAWRIGKMAKAFDSRSDAEEYFNFDMTNLSELSGLKFSYGDFILLEDYILDDLS